MRLIDLILMRNEHALLLNLILLRLCFMVTKAASVSGHFFFNMNAFIDLHIQINLYIHTYIYIRTLMHALYTCIYASILTHTHIYIHTLIQAYNYTYHQRLISGFWGFIDILLLSLFGHTRDWRLLRCGCGERWKRSAGET